MLVITDNDGGRSRLSPDALGAAIPGRNVKSHKLGARLRPNGIILDDYNWKKPKLDMAAKAAGAGDLVGILAARTHTAYRGVLAALATGGTGTDAAGRIRREAEAIVAEDEAICAAIGRRGLGLIEAAAAARPGQPVNVLTHCNAGALATLGIGTATAPIYLAQQRGIAVHVWIDETRPRNQGAQLTAWELARYGVPHTLIVDNAGGHLMQHGLVDLCITGTDRTTRNADVANKIGTYLKALAARDNGLPFYVALPSTSIDWNLDDGLRDIPIEERDAAEVTRARGFADGRMVEVAIAAPATPASNFAFDVTPARLVTGLVTERGICEASRAGLERLFPERARP
ncbi:MAG: S-methyl-5-thioribose-1-phosphate isomerase [Gammaproteobacteria bacterium]|nr:S-methyl-5-thioribose-1-phosphate isomerase [Gammaproteobacteria bacterium]